MFSRLFNKKSKSQVHPSTLETTPVTTPLEYKDIMPREVKLLIAQYCEEEGVAPPKSKTIYENYSDSCNKSMDALFASASHRPSSQISKISGSHGLNFCAAATCLPTSIIIKELNDTRSSEESSCGLITCLLLDFVYTAISIPVGVVGCVGITAVDATVFAASKIQDRSDQAEQAPRDQLMTDYGFTPAKS